MMQYYHVNVFSQKPLSGNGLTAVFPDKEIDDLTLGNITKLATLCCKRQ